MKATPKMNLMNDLETLGTKPNSPVLSIGAVFFDRDGLKDEFYKVLDYQQQIKDGRPMDWDTMKWWMFQDDMAKKVFKDKGADTFSALKQYVEFCKRYKAKPWGNGAGFDITILENILEMYGIEIPWKFWDIRDHRTFTQFFPKKVEREGTYHNALDDAKYQATNIIENLKEFPDFNI